VNESELAAGLGVTAPTVGRHLDVLEGLFLQALRVPRRRPAKT
jgi:hypothetical protein